VIVTSDRVTLYSKKEGVFLFGMGTVGISSPSTINLDTKEEVRVFSPKISLGAKATEPLVLGNSLTGSLVEVYDALQTLCVALSTLNKDNLSSVVDQIRYSSQKLSDVLNTKKIEMYKNVSKTSFTE